MLWLIRKRKMCGNLTETRATEFFILMHRLCASDLTHPQLTFPFEMQIPSQERNVLRFLFITLFRD